MKKIITLFLSALITLSVYAQSNKEDVDLIQAMYGKAKKELVIEFMKFTPAEGTAFWPVYDEFEVERKVIGRERINLITQYAENFAKMDDVKAADLGKKALENSVTLEKLNQKYFPKFSTAIGAVKAFKFMQLELYMQTMVRSEVQEGIPFIEELEKTEKTTK